MSSGTEDGQVSAACTHACGARVEMTGLLSMPSIGAGPHDGELNSVQDVPHSCNTDWPTDRVCTPGTNIFIQGTCAPWRQDGVPAPQKSVTRDEWIASKDEIRTLYTQSAATDASTISGQEEEAKGMSREEGRLSLADNDDDTSRSTVWSRLGISPGMVLGSLTVLATICACLYECGRATSACTAAREEFASATAAFRGLSSSSGSVGGGQNSRGKF